MNHLTIINSFFSILQGKSKGKRNVKRFSICKAEPSSCFNFCSVNLEQNSCRIAGLANLQTWELQFCSKASELSLKTKQKKNFGDAISNIQIRVNIHGLAILLDWCRRPSHCQALRDLTLCEGKNYIPLKKLGFSAVKGESLLHRNFLQFLKNVEILESFNFWNLLYTKLHGIFECRASSSPDIIMQLNYLQRNTVM